MVYGIVVLSRGNAADNLIHNILTASEQVIVSLRDNEVDIFSCVQVSTQASLSRDSFQRTTWFKSSLHFQCSIKLRGDQTHDRLAALCGRKLADFAVIGFESNLLLSIVWEIQYCGFFFDDLA